MDPLLLKTEIVKIHRASCLSCQSLWPSHLGLCADCWEFVFTSNSAPSAPKLLDSIPVRYLNIWERDQNRPYSLWIHWLKSQKRSEDLWSELGSQWMQVHWEKVAALVRRYPNLVIVPCPSLSGRVHAQLFAEALGRILQRPVYDCLRIREELHQKDLSRRERLFRNFYRPHQLPQDAAVVFVDDIMTTGGTTRAAIKALKPFAMVEVWCLTHRLLATRDDCC